MHGVERAYDRLFGAGARRGNLDLGFGLVVTGLLLAIVALGLFLMGEFGGGNALLWREAAIVLAAGGAPLALLGIAWALPGRMLTRAAGTLGALTGVVMAGVFALHYPYNFNIEDPAVKDYAPVDAAIYLGGATVLVTAILTEIVGMYVRRRDADGQAGERDWADTDYDVPDWVVERDIEEAMRMHEVTWEGASPLPSLEVHVPDQFEGPVEVRGTSGRRVRLDVPEVDMASQALRGIRDDSVSVGTSETDHAADALRSLRTDMRQHPKAYRTRRSWWQRLMAWLRRIAVRLRLAKAPAAPGTRPASAQRAGRKRPGRDGGPAEAAHGRDARERRRPDASRGDNQDASPPHLERRH